jgi:CheY-like chemotaxis protein
VTRVLIVMDEPDTMLAMRRDLEGEGHRTVLAADADTALRVLATQRIDIVLLDVTMPVRDGWSVLEALSGQTGGPRVVVVAATASTDDLCRAEQLGASGSLIGPHTAAELEEAVAKALTA